MTTRPLSIAMFLGFVLSVTTPLFANAANCTGACNPDSDECCKDDCSWEVESAPCIPFNHAETCRTKKCTYLAAEGNTNGGTSPQCVRDGFSNLPQDTVCIGTDPCAQGLCNGTGVCQYQSTNPCDDGNSCTNDGCTPSGTQGWTCNPTNKSQGTTCSITNPDTCKDYQCDGNGICAVSGDKPDNTTCGTFASAGTCSIKKCQGGACTGTAQGTVTCSPGVCENATCSFVGGVAHCDKTPKEQGTLCDTDPWDCKHQRCTAGGVCREYKATTLKECDADAGTAAHCKLSFCNSHKGCRIDTASIHYLGTDVAQVGGTWSVEDANTLGRNNRSTTLQFLCPASDNNFCTSDRCVGNNTDACHLYGCELNAPCPVPQCGDICYIDPADSVCKCRQPNP